MGKRGRKPGLNPAIKITIYITPENMDKLDLVCVDPLTKRRSYGKFKGVINEALSDYFKKGKL